MGPLKGSDLKDTQIRGKFEVYIKLRDTTVREIKQQWGKLGKYWLRKWTPN